jgi:hypothetical protein
MKRFCETRRFRNRLAASRGRGPSARRRGEDELRPLGEAMLRASRDERDAALDAALNVLDKRKRRKQ